MEEASLAILIIDGVGAGRPGNWFGIAETVWRSEVGLMANAITPSVISVSSGGEGTRRCA